MIDTNYCYKLLLQIIVTNCYWSKKPHRTECLVGDVERYRNYPPCGLFFRTPKCIKTDIFLPPIIYSSPNRQNTNYIYILCHDPITPTYDSDVRVCCTDTGLLKCHNLCQSPCPLDVGFGLLRRQGHSSRRNLVHTTMSPPPPPPPPPPPLIQSMPDPDQFSFSGSLGTAIFYTLDGEMNYLLIRRWDCIWRGGGGYVCNPPPGGPCPCYFYCATSSVASPPLIRTRLPSSWCTWSRYSPSIWSIPPSFMASVWYRPPEPMHPLFPLPMGCPC